MSKRIGFVDCDLALVNQLADYLPAVDCFVCDYERLKGARTSVPDILVIGSEFSRAFVLIRKHDKLRVVTLYTLLSLGEACSVSTGCPRIFSIRLRHRKIKIAHRLSTLLSWSI